MGYKIRLSVREIKWEQEPQTRGSVRGASVRCMHEAKEKCNVKVRVETGGASSGASSSISARESGRATRWKKNRHQANWAQVGILIRKGAL